MQRLAVYLRLSVEEHWAGQKSFESNSISSQRKLIYEFIRGDETLRRMRAEEFCDDGCSGTHMSRPAVQRLLAQIRAGRIQCVIVKDMSRFSRDYVEMGTYLNRIFPFLGVRFISVNDHYDSWEHRGDTIGLDTAFQTLLYDLYSKDISTKVRASLESRCAEGEYVFGQVPFGYEKSPRERNKVIVNKREAGVVLYIFSLAAQGKSSVQIARQLREEQVPTASQMRRLEKGKTEKENSCPWSDTAVRRILNNRFYLGEMAYGKTVRRAVGSKERIAVPRDEWKVIAGHHEALVSEEMFAAVSKFRPQSSSPQILSAAQAPSAVQASSRPQASFSARPLFQPQILQAAKSLPRMRSPLIGKIRCGGCGYAMVYKPARDRKPCPHFECPRHALYNIPECCTYVRAEEVERIVLLTLYRELEICGEASRLREKWEGFRRARIDRLRKDLKKCRQEKKKLQAIKSALYEQYALQGVNGLCKEAYREKAEKQEKALAVLEEKEQAIQSALNEWEKGEKPERLLHMEALTGTFADIFVRKVTVWRGKRIEITCYCRNGFVLL